MPDDSADGTESSFRVQFTRFAEEIRQLVTAVFGGDLNVVATHLASRSRIYAEVPLTVAGENLARLKIDVWCCLDSYQQFLAVEESTYQLIAQVDRAPIMRFEYERGATSKPRAHVQVHAHRGALSHLLSQARHPTPHSMESLHLPVGGDRFRPCLEDVIEFLVVECRFDCQEGWWAASEAGRERWRRMQTRTAVRDSPSEAAAALQALSYTVVAPETANGTHSAPGFTIERTRPDWSSTATPSRNPRRISNSSGCGSVGNTVCSAVSDRRERAMVPGYAAIPVRSPAHRAVSRGPVTRCRIAASTVPRPGREQRRVAGRAAGR